MSTLQYTRCLVRRGFLVTAAVIALPLAGLAGSAPPADPRAPEVDWRLSVSRVYREKPGFHGPDPAARYLRMDFSDTVDGQTVTFWHVIDPQARTHSIHQTDDPVSEAVGSENHKSTFAFTALCAMPTAPRNRTEAVYSRKDKGTTGQVTREKSWSSMESWNMARDSALGNGVYTYSDSTSSYSEKTTILHDKGRIVDWEHVDGEVETSGVTDRSAEWQPMIGYPGDATSESSRAADNGSPNAIATFSQVYTTADFIADTSSKVPPLPGPELHWEDSTWEPSPGLAGGRYTVWGKPGPMAFRILTADESSFYMEVASGAFRNNSEQEQQVLWYEYARLHTATEDTILRVGSANVAPGEETPPIIFDPRNPTLLFRGQNASYGVRLLPVELMVDASRDGEMSFTDAAILDHDQTTAQKPFTFWLNNDHDGDGVGEELESGPEDSADNIISSYRDTEDFTRLWISLKGLTEMVKAGGVQLQLEWKSNDGTTNWSAADGNPAIKIYRAAESDGGRKYVEEDATASQQIASPYKAAYGLARKGSTLMLQLSQVALANLSETQPNLYLIFEGVTAGRGRLMLNLIKAGQKVGEYPPLYLELKDVRRMYERVKAQPEGILAPYTTVSAPFAGPLHYAADPWDWPFEKPWDEAKQCIVFVHGWNCSYADFLSSGTTKFKRLWHQGFKGHLAAFRWETRKSDSCIDPGEYNRSENRAWIYGDSLKQWITALHGSGYRVSLIGHSMGNVVSSEAIRRGAPVVNYLMMEAAVPASCYDKNAAAVATLVTADTQKPTPDWDINPGRNEATKGSRGYLSTLGATVINFFNPDDFALATGQVTEVCGIPLRKDANWEKNQEDYKPDYHPLNDWIYSHATHTSIGQPIPLAQRAKLILFNNQSRYVTDTWEMKAFVSRSRTKAVGAGASGGLVSENINLKTQFGFGTARSDHSGQFTRRIQLVDDLYKVIRQKAEQ